MKIAVFLAIFALARVTYCQGDDQGAILRSAADDDLTTVDSEEITAQVTSDGMIEIEDMLLTQDQFLELYQPTVEAENVLVGRALNKKVAVAGRRWPNGVVPYQFAAGLEVGQPAIRAAMSEWEKYTCVRFVPKRPTDTAYVVIRPSTGQCSSAVGRSGGVQYINLGKNCGAKHILMHELGHTLGLMHEHQHPDRDKYVKILWNNIAQAHQSNFVMRPAASLNTFGIPYDASSIMHYSPTAFKNCANCKTIEPLDPNLLKVMGSTTLSAKSDIPIMKKMHCSK